MLLRSVKLIEIQQKGDLFSSLWAGTICPATTAPLSLCHAMSYFCNFASTILSHRVKINSIFVVIALRPPTILQRKYKEVGS